MDTQLDWNVVAHRSLSRKQGAPCSATGWWGCDSQPVRSASCATRTASPSVLRTSPSDYYSTRRKHHSILRPHASLLENPAICCGNVHILFVPVRILKSHRGEWTVNRGKIRCHRHFTFDINHVKFLLGSVRPFQDVSASLP